MWDTSGDGFSHPLRTLNGDRLSSTVPTAPSVEVLIKYIVAPNVERSSERDNGNTERAKPLRSTGHHSTGSPSPGGPFPIPYRRSVVSRFLTSGVRLSLTSDGH